MRSFTQTLCLLLLFPISSCGGPPKQDGVLLLSWTVRGAVSTVDACQGIHHLELHIAPDNAENLLSIEPIDCPRDVAVRYEKLSTGHATLDLIAFDVNGTQVARGSTRVDIEKMLPVIPATIDLR
jgi:hypothetical protein